MSVDIRIFADVVALILNYFFKIVKATKCNDEPHVDIELTKENDFNIINVTNCNCGDGDFSVVFVHYFNELCTEIKFDDYFKAITIFVKLANGEEAAYDFRYSENRVNRICSRNMNARESQRFAHLNEYQSFMLNSTLPSEDIVKFKEYVRGIDFHGSSLNSKDTFRCDKETIYQNRVISEKDMINCKLMSSAINKIIKKTTNDEFRQRCFSLLDEERTSLKTGDDVLNKFVSLLAETRQKNTAENKFSTFPKNHRTSKTNKSCREKKKIYVLSSDTDNDEENTAENKFSTFPKNHRTSKTNKTCRKKKKVYKLSSDTDNDEKNTAENKFSTFPKNHRTSKTNKTCRKKKKVYKLSSDTDNDEKNASADENKEPNIVSPISVTSRGTKIKRTKLCNT